MGSQVHVSLVTVPRSKQQLLSLEGMVAGDYSSLRSEGVPWARLSLDPVSGTVDVTLQTPLSPDPTYTSRGAVDPGCQIWKRTADGASRDHGDSSK